MDYWKPSPFAFIKINLATILASEFTAATCLISYCCILGVATPVQATLMVLFEVIFYQLNGYIVYGLLHMVDLGGAITVHLFATGFGLAVSRMLFRPNHNSKNLHLAESNYTSDGFAMIGTIILWCYWPSFNASVGDETSRNVAMMNTYLSMLGSAMGVYITSLASSDSSKLTMSHIQNATLAGGTAISACASMPVNPFGALLIGCTGGIISTLGFKYSQPALEKYVVDVAGVINLHGYPAVISMLGTVFVCLYGYHTADFESGSDMALMQFVGFLVTLGISVGGGILTGLMIKIPMIDKMHPDEYFNDEKDWEMNSAHDEESTTTSVTDYTGIESQANITDQSNPLS